MSPQIALMLAKLFIDKDGKPNAALKKYGKNRVASMLEASLKDGKMTAATRALVKGLQSGKIDAGKTDADSDGGGGQPPSKEVQEALGRLASGKDYSPSFSENMMLRIISPLLSGGARTAGNVLAAQKLVGPAIMQAVSDSAKNRYTGNIGNTTFGQMANAGAAALGPGLAARKAADIAGIQGIANTVADTIDNASQQYSADKAAERSRRYVEDRLKATGSHATEAETNLINQQLKQSYDREKRLAGGL